MKALVLENMSHSEERFNKYVKERGYKAERLNGIGQKSLEDISKFLSQPADVLTFESTFADKKQFHELLDLIVAYSQAGLIHFKKIEVMYTHNEFDIFLNRLVYEDKSFDTPLEKLFRNFEVYGVSWTQCETQEPGKYFKTFEYKYDRVRIERYARYKQNSVAYFLYQRSPILDLQAGLRTNVLLPVPRELLESTELLSFLEEVKFMLYSQQDAIEDALNQQPNDEETLQNQQRNKNHQNVLNALTDAIFNRI